MTAGPASLWMSEWETLSPDNCHALVKRFLDGASGTRQVASHLTESHLLGLTELRHGLQIQAFSHVGRIRLGDLTVTILPKLKGAELLGLLRFAYGFRRLNLISDSRHDVDRYGFEDLLICQLNAEVQELVARGLRRSYVSTSERLSSPRGRIDLTRLALDGGSATATLPCVHHPRIEDTLLNQVLMAGLGLAASMTSVVELRRESRRLISLLDEQVSIVRLDGEILSRALRQMNRLTVAYEPAISIIRLLLDARGVAFAGQATSHTLPGFLFDMNSFFQALVSRFLRDNLPDYSVRDEHALLGMMRYDPRFNPLRRQAPTPRPDFVVMQQGKIRAILDAKYRDLWAKPLPREMLYQLVVYAISQRERPQSCIVYPTLDSRAREARIEVTDPLYGRALGTVCLRPVYLPGLVELVSDTSSAGRRERERFARGLVLRG